MWFKKLFKSKSKKKDWFKQHPEVRIVPAFTLAATDEYPETTYYEFEDANNLSLGRGAAAQVVLQEMSMQTTNAFLVAHTTSIQKILYSKSIDIFKIKELNAQLAERSHIQIDSITPYKGASVIYFDETEDPFSYDYDYAWKKMQRWKKLKADFFLQTPIRKLYPSLDWSEETFQSYLKIAQEVDKVHYQTILDVLSQVLSEKELKSTWLNQLKLEKNII